MLTKNIDGKCVTLQSILKALVEYPDLRDGYINRDRKKPHGSPPSSRPDRRKIDWTVSRGGFTLADIDGDVLRFGPSYPTIVHLGLLEHLLNSVFSPFPNTASSSLHDLYVSSQPSALQCSSLQVYCRNRGSAKALVACWHSPVRVPVNTAV